MDRRNFLVKLFWVIVSFFLGYIFGKGGFGSILKFDWINFGKRDYDVILAGKDKSQYASTLINLENYKHLVLNIGTSKEDWEPAIKEAIKDIKKLGGGDIFFSTGKKRITKEIYIPSHVRLMGMGEVSEIWTDVNKINLIVSEVNAVGCEVFGLKITGSGFGVQPENSDKHQNVKNAGSGIIFRGVTKGRIKNCFISHHGGDRSTSNKNGVAGIWLTYGCEDCIITENYVENCRNGINEDNFFHRDAKNNLIQSNFVSNCVFGIATESDNGKGCKILNNTVKYCTYGAVDVNRSSNVIIQGNIFEGNGLTGEKDLFAATVTCYGSSNIRQENIIIENNLFISSHGIAVKIAQNNINSTIKENKINNCINRGGILVQGARFFSINNNTISNCEGSGIFANEIEVKGKTIAVDGCDISNNLVTECSEDGINLSSSGKMTISKNRILNCGKKAENTFNGIVFTKGTSDGVIEGNIIECEKLKYGIVGRDNESRSNIISNNRVVMEPKLGKYAFAAQQFEYNNN